MPIIHSDLMNLSTEDVVCSYSSRDVILYALGVGFCAEPGNAKELQYGSEMQGPATVPTMAATLAYPNFLADCGWDSRQVLHTEQSLELYRPLPAKATLLLNSRVAAAYDKGPGRGAEIHVTTDARLRRDETVVFSTASTLLARADGGFGGPAVIQPKHHGLPSREADLSCDLPIARNQGLLFRLSGDLNPLHVDSSTAKKAGFEQPILHGLCTYGFACRAILTTICDYDFTLIKRFDVRFSAPVYPGDVLTTEMWQDRDVISFRCKVKSRDAIVVNNGMCLLSG